MAQQAVPAWIARVASEIAAATVGWAVNLPRLAQPADLREASFSYPPPARAAPPGAYELICRPLKIADSDGARCLAVLREV